LGVKKRFSEEQIIGFPSLLHARTEIERWRREGHHQRRWLRLRGLGPKGRASGWARIVRE
jgi:hypothetical protein